MTLPTIPDLEVPKANMRRWMSAGAPQALDGRQLGVVTGFGLLEPRFRSDYPKQQNNRTTFGRSLNLARIHEAITSANSGWMEPLTDLGREAMGLDGHLSGVVQKRLLRVTALPWVVTPASGRGIDEKLAKEIADAVREQLEAIPNFADRLGALNWGLWDGRAAAEIGWKLNPGSTDRRWWIDDLYWIHPRRLSFGAERELRVIDGGENAGGFQPVGYDFREIPGKYVLYTPQLFCEYAEREGLCPRAMYWTFFARFGTRERMVLLELFGRPWRIVKPIAGAMARDDEAIEGAWSVIKNASGSTAIRMPDGYELDLESPPAGAGQVHADAIEHANLTNSKLVLGVTGTTDALPTGLGSSIGDAQLSEQDLVIIADARRLSESVKDQIVRPFVALNFGPAALASCSSFQLQAREAVEREKEAQRLKATLEAGLTVAAEQAYEVTGWRQPKPGEAVVRMVQRPAQLGAPQPAPAPEVVYPPGKAPGSGELAPTPEEALGPVDDAPAPGGAPPASP